MTKYLSEAREGIFLGLCELGRAKARLGVEKTRKGKGEAYDKKVLDQCFSAML